MDSLVEATLCRTSKIASDFTLPPLTSNLQTQKAANLRQLFFSKNEELSKALFLAFYYVIRKLAAGCKIFFNNVIRGPCKNLVDKMTESQENTFCFKLEIYKRCLPSQVTPKNPGAQSQR